MRVGLISLNFQYAVDLDNPEMVEAAKDAILEDWKPGKTRGTNRLKTPATNKGE